jgi:hypothetical protein
MVDTVDFNYSITEAEASSYVRMSQSFLRQARMAGNAADRTRGPKFLKIGRSVQYLRRELDIWLEQSRCTARTTSRSIRLHGET